jgi:uncharacterized protein
LSGRDEGSTKSFMAQLNVFEDDELGSAVRTAIQRGDIETLGQLSSDNPGLAAATVTRRAQGPHPQYVYPLIGMTTDWPGHFPNVGASIRLLVAHGADVNARAQHSHCESALHGAASSDDLEALDALLDAGADIEAAGAVIAGGTALDDAVAFGQWHAARRLVERGARTAVWHAAALGLIDRLEQYFAAGKPAAKHSWGGATGASPEGAVAIAFWCACHGGQRAAAEYLLARGGVLDWVSPWDGHTPLDAARRSEAAEVVQWLEGLGAQSAQA